MNATRTCHVCGAVNREAAIFCAGCGARLTTETTTCAHCGTRVVQNARFCETCGHPVKAPLVAATRAAPSRTWAVRLLGLVLGLAVGFFGVATYVAATREDSFIDGVPSAAPDTVRWREMTDPEGKFRFRIPPGINAYLTADLTPAESSQTTHLQASIHLPSVRVALAMARISPQAQGDAEYLRSGFSLGHVGARGLGYRGISDHAFRRPGLRGHCLEMSFSSGIAERRAIILTLRPEARPGERWVVAVDGPSDVLTRPATRTTVQSILGTLEFLPGKSPGGGG